MKHIILSLVVAVTVMVLSAGEAGAQVRWYAPHAYGYGGYGYGGYGGVQTPQSAAGHAMADMVRSKGMYNQMTSASMVNVEEARSKYIENQKQWTEVYLMKQRALSAEHARAKEEARARNARYQEYQATHSDLPPRLNSSQLDPSTGKITWPAALMRDSFADKRGEIDSLLASRVHTGTTSELSSELNKKVQEMRDELRKHIREIVTQEYLQARKFLDSLSLEGSFPLG